MERLAIDEAIAHAREVAAIQRNNDKLNKTLGMNSPYYQTDCLKCAEEHEQLAEWLEELKAYRAFDKTNFSDGYNKAIDDYMNKLCDHCMQQTNECYKLECPFCTDGCDIVNIAERLKAGGDNEQN